MTPSDFLSIFVEPNLSDFQADSGDIRKGINAAVSVFHLVDHYYKKNDPSKILQYSGRKAFLKDLTRRCNAFQDVQNVANVYKHLYQDTSKAHVEIESTGDVHWISRGGIRVASDLSEENEIAVVFRTKSGKEKDLRSTIEDVVAMWKQMI